MSSPQLPLLRLGDVPMIDTKCDLRERRFELAVKIQEILRSMIRIAIAIDDKVTKLKVMRKTKSIEMDIQDLREIR